MADFVDRKLGNFCKSIQQQIDELPLLDPLTKKRFTDMLEDCARKAEESPQDSIVMMKRELHPLRTRFKVQTGKDLKIS